MAASWKSRFPAPAGSVPGGLRTLLVWGGGGALVLAVMWNSLQRDRELAPVDPPNPAESQPPPEAAVAAEADQQIEVRARQMDEEERRLALQAAARQLDEQKRRRALQLAVGDHLRDPAGTLPPEVALPPGEYEDQDVIAEEIRQTEQRRKYESLRAPQIVMTAAAAPSEPAPAPDAALPDTAGPPRAGGPAPDAALQQSGDPLSDALARAIENPERYPHVFQGAASGGPGAPRPAAEAGAPAEPGPGGSSPAMLVRPDNPAGWERIYEGEFLECVLTTQLRGDFTGPANAMVAVDMWSRDRQRIVVPRGSRVLGTAAAVSATSQARLAVAFHRLIYPGGEWVDLDQFTGLNQMGETGLKDRVNNHYASMFGAAAAVGLLSGLAMQGAQVGYTGIGISATDRAQLGVGSGLANAGMAVVQRFTNRLPTVTIRAGHRLRVYFTSDVLVPREIGARGG